MKRLDTPLAATFFPNGGGDKKKKKKNNGGKNKSCTPTNMKACEGVGGPDAKGPKGTKGGPKPKPKGKGSNFRSPGGKRGLRQYCNTNPNYWECKELGLNNSKSKVVVNPKTGKTVR